MGKTEVNFKEVVREGLMLRVRAHTAVVTEAYDEVCIIKYQDGDNGSIWYDADLGSVAVLTKDGKPCISKKNLLGKYTFKSKRR